LAADTLKSSEYVRRAMRDLLGPAIMTAGRVERLLSLGKVNCDVPTPSWRAGVAPALAAPFVPGEASPPYDFGFSAPPGCRSAGRPGRVGA